MCIAYSGESIKHIWETTYTQLPRHIVDILGYRKNPDLTPTIQLIQYNVENPDLTPIV